MPDTLFELVSPDNAPNEWLESSDDMSAEDTKDFEKKMKRTRQRIAIIHHTSGFALAGIVFLILKS